MEARKEGRKDIKQFEEGGSKKKRRQGKMHLTSYSNVRLSSPLSMDTIPCFQNPSLFRLHTLIMPLFSLVQCMSSR